MSIGFNWEVLSVDSAVGFMIVKFTVPDSPDHTTSLNVPLPQIGSNLADHIKNHAPLSFWARIEQRSTYMPVSAGESGSATVELPVLQGVSQLSGDLQRERLKVLIQEVLDEQRENFV